MRSPKSLSLVIGIHRQWKEDLKPELDEAQAGGPFDMRRMMAQGTVCLTMRPNTMVGAEP
jgi:hypothetical protein